VRLYHQPTRSASEPVLAVANRDGARGGDAREAGAFNARGVARHRRGDVAGALAEFNRALEHHPGFAEAHNNRGVAPHDLGDFDGAVADLDRALELDPGYGEAYYNRGNTRRSLGELAEAVADFDRALDLAPGPIAAAAHYARGLARQASGDLDGSLADFDRVLALHPGFAEGYNSRGGVRHARGDFLGAIGDYNRELAIDPGLCVAYISRGNARHHRRDPACLADYRAAFRLDPALAAREIVRIIEGDVRPDARAALLDCRKHLQADPSDIVALARRAVTRRLQGRDFEAAEDLDRVRRIAPEWAPILDRLSREATRRREPAAV